MARHYGIRTERYKLINYYNVGEWELFDLDKDSQEMVSVYSDPDYADVVKDMKSQLDELRTQYNDTTGPGDTPRRKRPRKKKA